MNARITPLAASGGSGGSSTAHLRPDPPIRRPGRPVRLPEEGTPPDAPAVEPSARLAWLLVVRRLLHPEPGLVNRATLVQRLHEHDVAADVTRVSRWESGQLAPPQRLLEAYEQLLDLPPWTLVTLRRGLARVAGLPPGRLVVPTDGGSPATTAPLEHLLTRAVSPGDPARPQLSGAQWLQLADQLTGYELVFLDRGTWGRLCQRLLAETARCVGLDELLRYEAAATLMGHPVAAPHLVAAIRDWVSDPHAERLAPVIILLAESAEPTADALLSRLLTTTRLALRDAAETTAAVKLTRGLADRDLQARLEEHVRAQLTGPRPRPAPATLDLAALLSPEAVTRLVAQLPDPGLRGRVQDLARHRLQVPVALARRVARLTTQRLRAEVPGPTDLVPDPMLERLVTEVLFHATASRRWLSGAILAASPYRAALTEACLDHATSGQTGLTVPAWRALAAVADERSASRLAAAALAERRAGAQPLALATLGRSPQPLDETVLAGLVQTARATRHDGVHRAVASVLGRHDPDRLEQLTGLSHLTDGAVGWWRRLGPGLYDEPLSPAPDPVTG